MARKGDIEIPIAVDTSGVEKSIQNGLIDPIEDAEKALEALGKVDAGKDIDRSLKKAQDATEDLDDELDRTRKGLDKLGFAAKDAGRDGAAGLDRVRAGAQEVTQEVGQNLGEAVSSIRGDLSDLAQVGQDTLGGLAATVATMGPAGAVAAGGLALAAVAAGGITAELEAAKERQEKLNEAAGMWADAYLTGAGKIIDASHVVAEVQSIATDPDRYNDAKKAAEEWGVDVSTAMRTMAGDATALAVTEQIMAQRAEEASKKLAEQETQVDSSAGAVYDYADAVERGADRLTLQNEAMALGRERAREAAEALYGYASAAGEATGGVDDLGNKIVRLPDGKEIVIDANTRTAYEDIDAIEKRQVADKTVKIRVDDSEVRAYRPPVINIPGRIIPNGTRQIT